MENNDMRSIALLLIACFVYCLPCNAGQAKYQEIAFGENYCLVGKISTETIQFIEQKKKEEIWFFYPDKTMQLVAKSSRDDDFMPPDEYKVQKKLLIHPEKDDKNLLEVLTYCRGKSVKVYFAIQREPLLQDNVVGQNLPDIGLAIQRIDVPEEKVAFERELRKKDVVYIFNKVDIKKPFKDPFKD